MSSSQDQITCKSWLEDAQFALALYVRNFSDAQKLAHMQENFDLRYSAPQAKMAFESVRCACNWISRNWGYLDEVGLRRPKNEGGAINGGVIMALYNRLFSHPDFEVWERLPDVDPMIIVRDAQELIDAEKNPPTAATE